MIKVYIREENSDAKGKFLGGFMPNEFPQLITSFGTYDIYFQDSGTNSKGEEPVGQYVYGVEEVWFEIVVVSD